MMANKGDSSSPPLCCMCGDAGVPEELFLCKHCLVRSQHKYCSDLYPRSEFYKACNWCLREEEAAAAAAPVPTSSDNNGSGGSGTGVRLQRAAFSLQVNKPIKKQRVAERSASDVSDRLMRAAEELSPAVGRGRPVLRGKVRRYKLLEEVSS